MQRLGQHFLINPAALRSVASAVRLPPGGLIIEIGPGHGELTRVLRKTHPEALIVAIEKDPVFAEELPGRFLGDSRLEVISDDVRSAMPALVAERAQTYPHYVVVGNIPYYLTGFLFRLLGELTPRPTQVVLTIQKEVAERAAARPPHMNKLAASIQFWARPTVRAIFPRTDFRPPPKVDSALIVLELNGTNESDLAPAYYDLVHVLFQQPRKTITNNLGARYPKPVVREVLDALALDPLLRPQDLDAPTIKALARAFADR